MRKNLNHYLKLNYAIEIRKVAEKDGGGYLASIPQLGRWAFCGSGKNIDEALKTLERVKKNLFEDYLKEGISIPEPEAEPESIFSGKFVIRIPIRLHSELVERAREQNISLNQYVNYLLSYNTPLTVLEHCIRKLETTISKIQVNPVFISPVPMQKEGYAIRV